MLTTLLPEDGLLDEVAVDIAVRNVRPVALTPGERTAAVDRMLSAGVAVAVIARRLRMAEEPVRARRDQQNTQNAAA